MIELLKKIPWWISLAVLCVSAFLISAFAFEWIGVFVIVGLMVAALLWSVEYLFPREEE